MLYLQLPKDGAREAGQRRPPIMIALPPQFCAKKAPSHLVGLYGAEVGGMPAQGMTKLRASARRALGPARKVSWSAQVCPS
eukprot:6491394-Amphidinium_carterae.1